LHVWAISFGALSLISYVLVPFMAGVSFTLCAGVRAPMLDAPECARVYLLLVLIPAGLVTGFLQWLLIRRQARRSGWLVPAQCIGMAAFALVYVSVGSRVVLFEYGTALAGAGAGVAYALIVGLVLLRTVPRARSSPAT